MRRAMIAGAVLAVLSTAALAQATNVHYGDSITAGEVAGQGYPWLFAMVRGDKVNNQARGGSNFADVALQAYAHTPIAGERQFIMVGANDRIHRGDNAADLQLFQQGIGALLYKLGAQKATLTASGACATDNVYGFGYTCNNPGDTISFQFTGPTLALGYRAYDMQAVGGGPLVPIVGSFSVAVDGVNVGTFATTPVAKIASGPRYCDYSVGSWPCPFAPQLLRLTGFAPGVSHTAVLTVQPNTYPAVTINWASSGLSSGAPIVALTMTRSLVAAAPSCNGNQCYTYFDQSTAAYNSAISAATQQAAADGLNVTLVDTSAYVSPYAGADVNDGDLGPDNLHPSLMGQANLAAALVAAGIP